MQQALQPFGFSAKLAQDVFRFSRRVAGDRFISNSLSALGLGGLDGGARRLQTGVRASQRAVRRRPVRVAGDEAGAVGFGALNGLPRAVQATLVLFDSGERSALASLRLLQCLGGGLTAGGVGGGFGGQAFDLAVGLGPGCFGGP